MNCRYFENFHFMLLPFVPVCGDGWQSVIVIVIVSDEILVSGITYRFSPWVFHFPGMHFETICFHLITTSSVFVFRLSSEFVSNLSKCISKIC